MKITWAAAAVLIATLLLSLRIATAQEVGDGVGSGGGSIEALLSPPNQDGPVVVDAHFELHDINEIDDQMETFDIAGLMTLEWHDPRQAFDPAEAGVDEKVYQGDFQFNEVSPAWYPQVYLLNVSGAFEKSAVVLRVRPDGSSTLIESIYATAESDFQMRRFPFDEQQLQAVFAVPGFDRDEVSLRVPSESRRLASDKIRIPQWSISEVVLTATELPAMYSGEAGVSSAVVLTMDLARRSFYERRLVILPLAVIVLLSFTVFWMDRSSLGDRLNVSYLGILTAVTYQLVTSDHIPHISEFTLINGFLSWSFITMCGTVVVNLVVGSMDMQGRHEVGDRIDYHCRWIFLLIYFVPILTMVAYVFLT